MRHVKKIYISYRRDDTRAAVARIERSLEEEDYGQHIQIFRDGLLRFDDDAERVKMEMAEVDYVLALVGNNYATVADSEGRSRITLPDDYVVRELKMAESLNKTILPIRVDQFDPAHISDINTDLSSIFRVKALHLKNQSWDKDFKVLLGQLNDENPIVLEPLERPADKSTKKDNGRKREILVAGVIMFILMLFSGIAGVYFIDEKAGLQVEGSDQDSTLLSKPQAIAVSNVRSEPDFKYGELDPYRMVFIEGGGFEMGKTKIGGSIADATPHQVVVDDFWINIAEVSFKEYDVYCEDMLLAKPDDAFYGRGDLPVINISWYDAVNYCNWRSERDGFEKVYTINNTKIEVNWDADGYRLPTEAEWEYAARQGGEDKRFGNGKDRARPSQMNFNSSPEFKQDYSQAGSYRRKPVRVFSFAPNSLKLHNMSGNVWEWCWDRYQYNYYKESDLRNPKGPATGNTRVIRGGSFISGPTAVQVFKREKKSPFQKDLNLGFRLARSVKRSSSS